MLRYVASHHVASCRVMSQYVTSCHVMSRRVTSCHVIMPRDVPHVTSWHVTSCHITSCHVMSRHVMSRHVIMPRDVPHVTSCHVTSCHVVSHFSPSCHVMSYHVTSYHVESRGTVTRPTLHCQLTSSTRNQCKLSMTVFVGCPEGCRYNTASAVYDLVFMYTFPTMHSPVRAQAIPSQCHAIKHRTISNNYSLRSHTIPIPSQDTVIPF